MLKKSILLIAILLLLSAPVFAGSLSGLASSIGGGGGGNSDWLESCLDSCCSEAFWAGMRGFWYGATWRPWYFCSPWHYPRYGTFMVAEDEIESRSAFLMHLDFEARYAPANDNPGSGEIGGYRVSSKLYSAFLFNFGFYYQRLWEDLPDGTVDTLGFGGLYFTFGGWLTKNFNIDFGFGFDVLGGNDAADDALGVSFNAEGTWMTVPGLVFRWRFSYSWFDNNYLVDADISLGYILVVFEFRAGMWLMDTHGPDPIWGPFAGIAIWF